MNLKSIVSKLIPKHSRNSDEENPTSMVLLLKQPHFFTVDELRAAAEKAWSRSFEGGEDSRQFIVQMQRVTFVKVGPHVLNVLQHTSQYFELDDAELTEFLPESQRREAWRAHHAWCAIDYIRNKRMDEETKYCVLAALVAEMVDENCAGVWVPKTSGFMPNDIEFNGLVLYPALRGIALSKEINLD